MKRNLITLLVVIAAALLLASVALYTPQPEPTAAVEPPPALQALLLPEPRPLKSFALTDHNGKPLGLEQLKGQWSFLFFGYTHCPDICPTTLGMLKGVATKLEATPEINGDTRFLFVSVDPKRDTLPQGVHRLFPQGFRRRHRRAAGDRQPCPPARRRLYVRG